MSLESIIERFNKIKSKKFAPNIKSLFDKGFSKESIIAFANKYETLIYEAISEATSYKSKIDKNTPFFSRSRTIASIAAAPTFLTPKRP